MDKSDILEDIETKNQDIQSSNEELAVKLRKNKDLVDGFSKELESLRSEMAAEGLKSGTKRDIDNLKVKLEEKKSLISGMLDDLKPLEVDISRRENSIDALQQRISDQGNKIESLSQDLLDNKKLVQEFGNSNLSLKKKIVENEGIIKITKDKLTEKVMRLNEAEQSKMDMQTNLDAAKKESFTFKNRLGAMENRIHSTDEQNQKLLYEMIKMKDHLSSIENALEEKTLRLEKNDAEHIRNLEVLKHKEEEKQRMIMKNHAKKVTVLNSAISSLKTKLQGHQAIIKDKTMKERELMSEFSSRMQELMAARSEIDFEEVDDFIPDTTPELSEKLDQTDKSVNHDYDSELSAKSSIPVNDMMNDTFADMPQGPSKMDEILPMIELATDHGDDAEQIRHSLHSSGYSQTDIDDAFSKLNL